MSLALLCSEDDKLEAARYVALYCDFLQNLIGYSCQSNDTII